MMLKARSSFESTSGVTERKLNLNSKPFSNLVLTRRTCLDMRTYLILMDYFVKFNASHMQKGTYVQPSNILPLSILLP